MRPAHVRQKGRGFPRSGRPCGNAILGALPSTVSRGLIARCEPVDLQFGAKICESGDRIQHVYFPIDSFISLISSLDARPRLEVGLVGSEGMVGAPLLLGVDVTQLRTIVQGAGRALRMSAPQFSRELQHSPALEATLKRYVYVLMSQLAQLAACTHFHVLEARLARWLLMTRDRAHADTFDITQEFLAYMLGVRRVGITNAAGVLRKRRLIRYARGRMTILDRRGLEAVSCECYAVANQMYDEVMN
jgi:CRP-like cAMP-binding protein